MKYTLATTLFVAAISALPSDISNVAGCVKRDPQLVNAIYAFCNKRNEAGELTNDLVVPSEYAQNGVNLGGWVVKITGGCDPAQWVPADICLSQFHQMCSSSADTMVGFNGWEAGHQGQCQAWFYGRA